MRFSPLILHYLGTDPKYKWKYNWIMAQLTIYLDEETTAIVKAAVKESGVSQSQWIAEAVRRRARSEWPPAVAAMIGAWPDFPTAEEIRKKQAPDARRERL